MSATECTSCLAEYFLLGSMCIRPCPASYYGALRLCFKCVEPCYTCAEAAVCLTCVSGFLYQGSCTAFCPPSMFGDVATVTCQPCTDPCLTCDRQATTCLTCTPSSYLLEGSCLSASACTGGSLRVASSPRQLCQPCQPPCRTCEELVTACLSCSAGFFVPGAEERCQSGCPARTFPDAKSMTCTACPDGCEVCSDLFFCSQCAATYFFNGYTCLQACPRRFYGDATSRTCSSCSPPCFTCFSSAVNCTSCANSYLAGNSCVSQADCSSMVGRFPNNVNLQCEGCSEGCLTCVYTPANCLSCGPGRVLSAGSCDTGCSAGFYLLADTCLSCVAPCKTCSSYTGCDSCVAGYFFNQATNVCFDTCPLNTWLAERQCRTCVADCADCRSDTTCVTCVNGHFLGANGTTCLTVCADTFFGEVASQLCLPCMLPCRLCSALDFCLSCAEGFALAGNCVVSCPDRYFDDSGSCAPCADSCLFCFERASACTSCSSPLYLADSQCAASCPHGFYQEQLQRVCAGCQYPCAACTGYPSNCTDCAAALSLYQNNCLPNCPANQFSAEGQCHPCSEALHCEFCEDSLSCLNCKAGFFLAAGMCLAQCPSGQFGSEGECQRCRSPCATCNATHCLSCLSVFNFYEAQSVCVNECPTGFHAAGNLCSACSAGCAVCLSQAQCISCSQGQGFEGRCLEECPPGRFSSVGVCQPCSLQCKTCSSKFNCTACEDGNLDQGFCYSECNVGKYASSAHLCLSCSAACTSCLGAATACTGCAAGQKLYLGGCHGSCPPLSFAQAAVCTTCIPPCLACTSAAECSSCRHGFVLYNDNQCVAGPPCPNSYYFNREQRSCVTLGQCAGLLVTPSAMTCGLACALDTYDNQRGSCVEDCGPGFFVDEGLRCQPWSQLAGSRTVTASGALRSVGNLLFLDLEFNDTMVFQANFTARQVRLTFSAYTGSRLLQASLPLPVQLISAVPFRLQVLTNQSLPSGQLDVRLLNSSAVVRNGQGLPVYPVTTAVNMEVFYFYSLSERQTGRNIGYVSQSIVIVVLLVMLILLVLNRGSEIYLVLDFMQIVYALQWLSVKYPPNLLGIIQGFSPAMFYFVVNIFRGAYGGLPLQHPAVNFTTYNPDASFLRMTGQNFLLLMIVLFFFAVAKSSLYAFREKSENPYLNKYKAFCLRLYLRFRWHYANDFVFLTFLNAMVFFFAQMQDLAGTRPIYVFSDIIWILFGAGYLAFPAFVAYKLRRHFRNIRMGKPLTNLQCFIRGLNKDSGFAISLIVVRYLRKLACGLAIGLLGHRAMYVLPILTAPSVLLLFFFFVTKPYTKRLANTFNLITEALLVLLLVLVTILKALEGRDSAAVRLALGWAAVALIFVSLFLHAAYLAAKLFF